MLKLNWSADTYLIPIFFALNERYLNPAGIRYRAKGYNDSNVKKQPE